MSKEMEFLKGVDKLHAFYTEHVRMLAHAYDLSDEDAAALPVADEQRPPDVGVLPLLEGGVELARVDLPGCMQALDLVALEGDQRRDHEGEPAEQPAVEAAAAKPSIISSANWDGSLNSRVIALSLSWTP